MVSTMTLVLVVGGVVLLTALAEALHLRRIRRAAPLAFGPSLRPAAWVVVVPPLRVLAAGAITFGLLVLMTLPPRVHTADTLSEGETRHLVLVLDVSPSMRLKDAGPTGQQTRRERARDLVDSLFARVSIGRYVVSVVAVYNGAKPVVVETRDSEVVRNILSDLPMEYAFTAGKTTLLDGIEEGVRLARPWRPKSTLLVVVSDGDTVPATGMPALPPSLSGVLVIGVGDPLAGRFIDGRQSRQDTSTLRQIAARMGGRFFDGNRLQVPTEAILEVTMGGQSPWIEKLTLREYALLAVVLGALWLALHPLLLHLLGTAFRPGVRLPQPARS